MKTKYLLNTIFGLFLTIGAFAQFTITLPETVNLSCPELPFPEVCVPIEIEVHNEWINDLNEITVILTNPNGANIELFNQSTDNNSDTFGSVDFQVCHSFLIPGTYTLCVTAVDRRWWSKDKKITNCMTINVGDVEAILEDFDNHVCEYESFRWCPGDFGIEAMNPQPTWGLDIFVAPSGCITIWVGDIEYERTISIPVLAEICGFLQQTTIDLVVGGCETFNPKDPIKQQSARVQMAEFSIYPNPVSDILNIRSSLASYTIQLIDNLGRTTQTLNLSYDATIDLSKENPGVYYILIQEGQNRSYEKIIIK